MANDLVGDSNSHGCTNSSGRVQFHLRRVGPPASHRGLDDIMDLHNITNIIGSRRNQVDYLIDSSDYVPRLSIFRCRARVVRDAGNQHRLHDDNSCNGIFVNNIKIAGSCILREGDMVTFGHPFGSALPAGTCQRQPYSEHQFIFERCNCSTGNHRPRPVQTSAEGQCMQSSNSIEAFSEATGGVHIPKPESLDLITSSVISSDTHDKVYVHNSLTTGGNEKLPTKDKVSAIGSDLDDTARDELKHTKGEQNTKRKSNLYQNDSLKKIKTEDKTEIETEMEESVSEKCMMTSDTAADELLSGCDVLAIETGNNSTPKEMPKTPLPGCSYTQDDTARPTVKRSSYANNDGKQVDDQKNEAVDVPDENTQSIESHVQTCSDIIESLSKTFESEQSLKDIPRIMTWSQDLKELEKKLEFPKTIIAVVGDTGVGKSSLMNAILDHHRVLPTSGIRACTAVVVEVIQNTTNSNFEADIELLKREEWLEELNVLTRDLKDENLGIQNKAPDPKSDAYVSYCKVIAVHGRTGTFDELSRDDILNTLFEDPRKKVSSETLEEFQSEIAEYIETQEPRSGGQYWPIVKHVRLHMPGCDVCSSGAALVDLPGTRDSNAVRDKIAREYLKNCTAVWIVTGIHRAIDDKTAKDLLGDSFRRQLLMDGLYGSITFICTKTDDLMPSEIIKSLRLENETNTHQVIVKNMTQTKKKLKSERSNFNSEMRELSKNRRTKEAEAEKLKNVVMELETETTESEKKCKTELALAAIESEISGIVNKIKDLDQQKINADQKIMKLDSDVGVEYRAIKVICAKARNEYSKREIRRDFKAGMKEMNYRAGVTNEDLLDLNVFCCSSTEYQKLMDVCIEDGPPQVFDDIEATEIPAVRRYVHEITSVRRRQALETLIRGLGRFVFDIHNYIVEENFQGQHNRSEVESLINSHLTEFEKITGPIRDTLSNKIGDEFEKGIFPKLQQGANIASDKAPEICAKWGAPKRSDRKGGLPLRTYIATTRREGMFQSLSYGTLDFNEQLSEPMLNELTVVWDETFSRTLYQILDDTQKRVLEQLPLFTEDLCNRLHKCGVAREHSDRVGAQLMITADDQLTEMIRKLKEQITTEQREINRLINPQIREAMKPTYAACSEECGKDMFKRMKSQMETDVDTLRNTMYDGAKYNIIQALEKLKKMIIDVVNVSCQTLKERLKTAFEPLWNDIANMQKIRAALGERTSCSYINDICNQVQNLYTDAGLTNREGYIEDLHPGHGEPARNTAEPSTTTAIS